MAVKKIAKRHGTGDGFNYQICFANNAHAFAAANGYRSPQGNAAGTNGTGCFPLFQKAGGAGVCAKA